MTKKQAKKELAKILNQKTVSIPRLKRVLAVLDYELLERQYINQGKRIMRQAKELNYLQMSGRKRHG